MMWNQHSFSRRTPKEDFKKNVNLVRTSWKSDHITDSELKDFIKRSLRCLYHWLNLLAIDKAVLQAMAMGVLVMISDTMVSGIEKIL